MPPASSGRSVRRPEPSGFRASVRRFSVNSMPLVRRAINAMAAAFADAGLPCVLVADVRALLWAKFLNAIGVFGVSALTGVPSVEIFARLPLALAYRSLLEEGQAVAGAEGVEILDFPDLAMRTYLQGSPEEAAAIMASRVGPPAGGPPGYSSMAQDLAAGRPTEIEETFGDLVRRANTHGLHVPRSELVYRVVLGREQARVPRAPSTTP